VQEAYRLWITALIEGGKCAFSKTTVQLFHETMTRYTQDPVLQVDILKKAAASGYPNAEWVINSLQKGGYHRQCGFGSTATHIGAEQKQFEGVSEESF
jgi:glutaredoxin-related protein